MSGCFSAVTGTHPDPFKRVKYPLGLVLGVAEMEQEQAYFLERGRLHNRSLHGYGTVCGLQVTAEGTRVVVTSGLAVVPAGKEVRVTPDQCADLNDWLSVERNRQALLESESPPSSPPASPPESASVYVTLCYLECETDPVSVPGAPCRTEDESLVPSRITESFELKFTATPPAQLEEAAVLRLGHLLDRLDVTAAVPGLSPAEMAQVVRTLEPGVALMADPPLPLLSPPGADLPVHPDNLEAVLREIFRVWVTEVRPTLLADGEGCAGAPPAENCVLLTRVDFTLDDAWQAADLTIVEDDRPFLLQTRLLQESLMDVRNGVTEHHKLVGLAADDHVQYLLINGTRAMTGDLNAGGHKVANLAVAIASGEAVPFQQAIKVSDAAGGDLSATYPDPRVARLQGHPVSDTAPADGEVLTWAGTRWTPQAIPPGITAHGDLTDLEQDDHKQYLLVDGTRALGGNLAAGGHKVTGLAAATAAGDAVRFQQAIKVGDAAGGDLEGAYPSPAVVRIQGRDVADAEPAEGDVLVWNAEAGVWEPKSPSGFDAGGVTSHGALTGLTNDDHPQYLLASGARGLTGNLPAAGRKVVGLAAATLPGDAVPFEQAVKRNDPAGGDLLGPFPNPLVARLHGRPVANIPPAPGSVLSWTGAQWEPRAAAGGIGIAEVAMGLPLLPLVTITPELAPEGPAYELWFHLQADGRPAAANDPELSDEFEFTVWAETNNSLPLASPFLQQIQVRGVQRKERNIYRVFLDPEATRLPYLRFIFTLKAMFLTTGMPLDEWARRQTLKWVGHDGEQFVSAFCAGWAGDGKVAAGHVTRDGAVTGVGGLQVVPLDNFFRISFAAYSPRELYLVHGTSLTEMMAALSVLKFEAEGILVGLMTATGGPVRGAFSVEITRVRV